MRLDGRQHGHLRVGNPSGYYWPTNQCLTWTFVGYLACILGLAVLDHARLDSLDYETAESTNATLSHMLSAERRHDTSLAESATRAYAAAKLSARVLYRCAHEPLQVIISPVAAPAQRPVSDWPTAEPTAC